MGFFDILGSGLFGSLINAGVGVASMKAQERMNKANIAAQERINQANIDQSNHINDLMRHDTHNSVNYRKQDLINSGYSTANPNMDASQSASLTVPQLTAPHSESVMTPEAASSFNGIVPTLLNASLVKAQTRETNANADIGEKEAAWTDAKLQAEYDNLLQQTDNLKKDGVLKTYQASLIRKGIDKTNQEIELLIEQTWAASLENKFKPDVLLKTIQTMDKTLSEIDSRISSNYANVRNKNADTKLKGQQFEIGEFEKQIKEVEANFAQMGVNFNGQSILDTCMRLAASSRSSELGGKFISFVRQSFQSILTEFDTTKEYVKDELSNRTKRAVARSAKAGPMRPFIGAFDLFK